MWNGYRLQSPPQGGAPIPRAFVQEMFPLNKRKGYKETFENLSWHLDKIWP